MRLNREELYEGFALPKDARELAALVLSKVFYYLGQYDESLSFALRAGRAFQTASSQPGAEEYMETIVCEFVGVMCCAVVG